MQSIELHKCISSQPSLRLSVYECTRKSHPGQFLLKQYACLHYSELDPLLKEAISQAQQPYPTYAVLSEVILKRVNGSEFTVNFVYEKFGEGTPSELISKDDRSSQPRAGLGEYRLDQQIYGSRDSFVSVFEAWAELKHIGVIVKRYGPIIAIEKTNRLVKEAIVQASVAHTHNCALMDVAITAYQPGSAGFMVCLVMEKLRGDVGKEIKERKMKDDKYSEEGILMFLKNVTAGLIQAKSKKIAHRDLKPANIFLSYDGLYKLGDFGSAWVKSKETLNCTPNKTASVFNSKLFTPLEGRVLRSVTDSGDGTICYLSPEMRTILQDRPGAVDPFASDVYSLGITVLELALLDLPEELVTIDLEKLKCSIEHTVNQLPFSVQFKSMLKAMLNVDPKMRPIAEMINIAVDTQFKFTFSDEKAPIIESLDPMHLAALADRYERMIATLKHSFPAERKMLAYTYSRFAVCCKAQKRFQQAEQSFLAALEIHCSLGGDDTEESAKVRHNLSYIYQDIGDFHKAEEFADLSLRTAEKLASESLTAQALSNLSDICREKGNYGKSWDCGLRALKIQKRLFGEIHFNVASTFGVLSLLCGLFGDFERAQEYALNALSILDRLYGETNVATAIAYNDLAVICKNRGDLRNAEVHALHGLRITANTVGENSTGAGCILNVLAIIYFQMGEFKSAEAAALKSLSIFQRNLSDNHRNTASVYANLSCIYISLGELQKAELFALQSLSHQKRILGERHIDTAASYTSLGSIYHTMGNLQKAEENALRAHSISINLFGENHINIAVSSNNLALIYADAKDFEQAERFAMQALALFRSIVGDYHLDTANGYDTLAVVYFRQGKYPQAKEMEMKALDLYQRMIGSEHKLTKAAWNNLRNIEKRQHDL